jgi:hypothetical protein
VANKHLGAQGFVGIAIEAEAGTYVAPTKFFPIRSESLGWTQDTNFRRVIRGTADAIGAIPGNGNVEGDLDVELLTDVLPYFLLCARGVLDKTGVAAPFVYDFVPAHNALAPNTMSITVVRGEEAFGYVGCVLSSISFGVDNNMGTMNLSILGTAEESVTTPATPTYGADIPFGAGTWNIQVPTDTQIFDADNFTFEINDNGTVQHRLKSELGAEFISFGERQVTMSVDRDFDDRAEFDAFKNLTSRSVTVALGGAGAYGDTHDDNEVEITMPVAYVDGYDVGLSGPGDLVRASMNYEGVHDNTTGGAYSMQITTAEDVTIPS